MKTQAQYISILKEFLKKYASAYGILELGIFGSVARNEHTETSDIDIYVLLEQADYDNYCNLKNHLENFLGNEVDLIRKRSTLRPLLLQHINRYGIQI